MSKELVGLLLVEEKQNTKDDDSDLTLCGICRSPMQNPKALPCLHSFCFGCIEEWTQGQGQTIQTGDIKCPQCKVDFPLPPEGVSGLRSNFLVIRLKEKRTIMEEEMDRSKPVCACEESDINVAVARCLDCKGYLCNNCVAIHKTEGHQLSSLDDIRSGKVDIHKTSVKEFCAKHDGQVLCFFCETCEILICHDCTVVDHPATKHTLVNVEEISGVHGKRVAELSSRCKKVVQQVEKAIIAADGVENDLIVSLQKANIELEHSAAQSKDQFLTILKHKQQELSDKIDKTGKGHKSQITLYKHTLESQRLRLRRALQLATHITVSGSPYDLAMMYTTLTDTLQKLSEFKLKPASVSSGVTFAPNKDNYTDVSMLGILNTTTSTSKSPTCGSIVSQVVYDVTGEWELERLICDTGETTSSFAVYPSGDIAVGYYGDVIVYDQDGKSKHIIDVNQDDTRDPDGNSVAISTDGTLFVVNKSPFVKVFDVNAKLVNTFQSIPPSNLGMSQSLQNIELASVTFNNQNQIVLVGDIGNCYISIHKQNGSHVSSFKISIKPLFIATAPHKDIVIVTDRKEGNDAHIVDYTGKILHTISTPPCFDQYFIISGAHFNGDNEIILAMEHTIFEEGNAIYHYSTEGEYLDCITNKLENPREVTITGDGKLLVLEWNGLLVFRRKFLYL